MRYLLVIVFALFFSLHPCTGAEENVNLVPDGDFSQTNDSKSVFKNWYNKRGNWSLVEQGGNKWAKLEGKGSVQYEIKLNPEWQTVKVSCRMKTTGALKGDQNWQTARVAFEFLDDKRKHVGKWPKVPSALGDKDWFTFKAEYTIPSGATRLKVTPANMGNGGIVEFDDIIITKGRKREPLKDLPAPTGFTPDPSLSTAWKQQSQTQQKICLNSLWQFIPVGSKDAPLPQQDAGWGWFKVPGLWPTRPNYSTPPTEQKILLCTPMEEKFDLYKLQYAWYKRDIVIPADWKNKKIQIEFTMLQSYAKVLVDGKTAGELLFPGGFVDITKFVTPGKTQQIAIFVGGIRLSKERTISMAADRTFIVKGGLKLKGITSDLFLLASPQQGNLTDMRLRPSFRKKSLTIDISAEGLSSEGATLELSATCGEDQKTFTPLTLNKSHIKNGRIIATLPWDNPKLWDTDTPGNMYKAVATLKDAKGKVLGQTLPVRFGFREFWIDGRNFYLNGKRIHLRALVLDNMNMAAGRANKASCVESMKRLKSYGFNFFITHNYNFAPGTVSYMQSMLEAADEQGVLCAFSMPHVRDFSIKLNDEKIQQRYRALADRLSSLVGNHPSITLYTMNHNACGYKGDQNPLYMDGKFDPTDPATGGVPSTIRTQALQAAQICKEVDPSRPVYHHSSGNLGDMYTLNIYLDWAPRQERSDWLEHWEKEGTKPMFFVEWGLPHNASWSSYRGPHFIWRTPAWQHAWTSEFAVVDMGDDAYNLSAKNLKAQQSEVDLFNKGKVFTWSSLSYYLRQSTHNYLDVQSWFAADNWRSHRARGLSAGLPWDQKGLWKREGNFDRSQLENTKPYAGIDQPGIIPDMAKAEEDYLYAPAGVKYAPTILGKTFLRWNMPLCAFIGGKINDFSEKKHVYKPGDPVSKSFIIINDTRQPVKYSIKYELTGSTLAGTTNGETIPGNRSDIPLNITLPDDINPGEHRIKATFTFSTGETQQDEFSINVIPTAKRTKPAKTIYVYDPVGSTKKELDKLAINYTSIDNFNNINHPSIVIIGSKAIKMSDSYTNLSQAIKNGARIIIFEQEGNILRDRLGMRYNIHGMRTVYKSSSNAPVTGSLDTILLKDWGGKATATEPYLQGANRSDPQWNWLGYDNTRVWRCGNRGNVASILPEKPVLGNFTPLALCGFDLQYTPLLQYKDGKGLALLCQLDVTARTENSPAAQTVLREMIRYADSYTPAPSRHVLFSGSQQTEDVLKKLNVSFEKFSGTVKNPDKTILILGNGFDSTLNVSELATKGVNILCLGLDQKNAQKTGIPGLTFKQASTLAQYSTNWNSPALLAVGNQDLFWRDTLDIAEINGTGGIGNNALRAIPFGKGSVVFCQATPWMFEPKQKTIFRKSLRRNYWLVAQLLRNLGADLPSPFLANLSNPSRPSSIELPPKWVGLVDKDDVGRKNNWFSPSHDTNKWQPIKVPGMFDAQIPELADYDGLFWYRLDFDVPSGFDGEGLELFLGAVDDESWVWLNGEFIGEVSKKTNPKDYYRVSREYALKKGSLKPGQKNTLVVLVNDTYLKGGMRSKPALRSDGKWLNSYYIQTPKASDDPYRYYRW